MTENSFYALPQPRQTVCRVSNAHGLLPVEALARLLLPVTDAAAGELSTGRPVVLSTAREVGTPDDSPVLAIALRAPQTRPPLKTRYTPSRCAPRTLDSSLPGPSPSAAGEAPASPCRGSGELLNAEVHPGYLITLCTDGLTESRRDPYEGELRLAEAARRHTGSACGGLPSAIAADMHTAVPPPDGTLAPAIRRTHSSP